MLSAERFLLDIEKLLITKRRTKKNTSKISKSFSSREKLKALPENKGL